MHAHTCTTVPTFAHHESQSAFELRPPPVRNEICQSRKQTGTGIPLPVAVCWRGQVLENPELHTPKFVCSKCAERAHDLCFFTLWNQEELVEKENNEADNQEKMQSLWLQLSLKHHSNSSKAQLIPLLRMCYVSKQRHYYKNVWWKVMWDGPGLEMMGNTVFAAVRGVESHVLSLNMSKISIYLIHQTLQGDKWWWGQTFMVPSTVHCHLFLIRFMAGRSPAVCRWGALLRSLVHLVFRTLGPNSRHDLNVPLFDFIVP